MPTKLLSLQSVPEDEENDIREILDSNNINYYVTPSGNWGGSLAAIWLNNEKDVPQARELICLYQKQRATNARKEYENEPKSTLREKYKKDKFTYTFFLLILVIVIYMVVFGVRHPM